jgi:hypothetical protein
LVRFLFKEINLTPFSSVDMDLYLAAIGVDEQNRAQMIRTLMFQLFDDL